MTRDPRETETASSRYAAIEDWPTGDLVGALIDSQYAAIAAVQATQAVMGEAIDRATLRLARGGRLIYMGAGTSGRIATQDAVELRPTFSWPESRSVVLMAGGEAAFTKAREGAEDSEAEAVAALDAAGVGEHDVVLGLAASGTTPYTLAGLRHARNRGALAIGFSNNLGSPMREAATLCIEMDTGAEPVAGSTRMKAGTAQKVALNAFSTAVMIRLGHVYKGLMVEMKPTNAKLKARAVRIVADLTGKPEWTATEALDAAGGSIKLAAIMLLRGLSLNDAQALLDRASGNLRRALEG
ncbi:N-acetylmuramic acid 6-phosphate etherase [Frigidibacter sp. ROC022]|uniref:N-acetylmuramic acid 6-phosphate etherase n=1 Tax=Frigidibacter sp. ROC022 TaxID=2971796 RepID=UPI00215AF78C|nr:N-acetylmuramic acid 6-phosphate etherase [Frigidibacter sp. ROC022]MCR8724403.1 N-acetylmuramic acid 6-phosphate etherase [Frigidibacter sp. ROC022]